MAHTHPRFVSFVAFSLGTWDIVRGLAHTFFSGHAARNIAGLDLSGHTGYDQLMLMNAFGASNFISAFALIYLSLKDKTGALIMLTIIPVAYTASSIGLSLNEDGLQGVGVFPGRQKMIVYNLICIATVISALFINWRRRGQNSARS